MIWSYVMFVLPNVTLTPSNVTKNIREPLNVINVWLYMMLILFDVTMELLNVNNK